MAALAETSIKRYSTPLGPIRMEVLFLTTVSTGDTFTTLIANPLRAIIGTSNTGGATVAPAVTFGSGATAKVGTVTQTSLTAGTATVIVFGF